MNYAMFYKTRYESTDRWLTAKSWDVFLSAYNLTDRVKTVFERVQARDKFWLVHREYGFLPSELPSNGTCFSSSHDNEGDYIQEFFRTHAVDFTRSSICIDITGFMRPHLLFVVRYLASKGIRKVDVLYSEPIQYRAESETAFTLGDVSTVRQVAGFEGMHEPGEPGADLLIVGSGYEHRLISDVAYNKKGARKVQLLGFPPLQADFYQQNILQAAKASEALGSGDGHTVFAPANDPFTTADVLQKLVNKERLGRGSSPPVKNVYLSPLATRAQCLGFGIYYLFEGIGQAVSIIYPFTAEYHREASSGFSHVWQYSVEFPSP